MATQAATTQESNPAASQGAAHYVAERVTEIEAALADEIDMEFADEELNSLLSIDEDNGDEVGNKEKRAKLSAGLKAKAAAASAQKGVMRIADKEKATPRPTPKPKGK